VDDVLEVEPLNHLCISNSGIRVGPIAITDISASSWRKRSPNRFAARAQTCGIIPPVFADAEQLSAEGLALCLSHSVM
jgi:hypothetical protein